MSTQIIESEAYEQDPIAVWLIRQFETEEDGELPSRLVLGHLNQHDVPSRMEAFKIKAHTEEVARGFASQLRYLAKADADTRQTTQRYSLQCFWPNKDSSYTAFTERGTKTGRDALALTEPPDLAGVTKMLMRHLEASQRMSTQTALTQQEQFLQREQAMQERLATMETDRMNVVVMAEQLLDRRQERALLADAEAKAQERKDLLVGELAGLLPIVKAKIAGHLAGGAAPGDQAAQREAAGQLMEALFSNLGMEEVRGLLQGLPPAKQGQLMELYNAVMLHNERKQIPTDAGGKENDH